MPTNEWTYRLSLSTMLDRNGFMLPGSRAEQRQPDASRMPRRRGTAAVTALAVAPLVLAVVALLHG